MFVSLEISKCFLCCMTSWRPVSADKLNGEVVVDCFGLATVGPDDSLYDVVCSLHSSGFHRLPIIDAPSNNVLYTLGYRRILQFICLFVGSLTNLSAYKRSL